MPACCSQPPACIRTTPSSCSAQDLPALRALLAQPAGGRGGRMRPRLLSQLFVATQAQRRAFEWQLQLALDSGKPVFLHQRDAHADFVALLREHRRAWSRGVAHCFTGRRAELELSGAGLSIGITGWINDERRGAHLAALVAHAFRRSGCCSRPTRPICCRAICAQTQDPGAMSRCICRTSEPPWRGARRERSEDCAAHTSAHARELFRPAAALSCARHERKIIWAPRPVGTTRGIQFRRCLQSHSQVCSVRPSGRRRLPVDATRDRSLFPAGAGSACRTRRICAAATAC
jgi:hypothetical protein